MQVRKGLQRHASMSIDTDTICAVATPAGRGGVAVIRVSGPSVPELCRSLAGKLPAPRSASLHRLHDADGALIDEALLLYFPAPASFTGEHVLELQTHGSPVVTDLLIQRLLQLGARIARPGEFSERAFLNNKLDLAQAEAIADLINSASVAAARFALRSLQGEFSRLVDHLVEGVTLLRIYIEAALDFPEEEIDFISEGDVAGRLRKLQAELSAIQQQARQGALVREGIKVAIVGEPNAGKSTLLNALSGEDTAIVSDIPGTTRDILRQTIHIDGLPIHVLDTAGLRDSDDPVEQEGIRRARQAIADADVLLLLCDARERASLASSALWRELSQQWPDKLLPVFNKIDLLGQGSADDSGDTSFEGHNALQLSARHGLGMDQLRARLKQLAGFNTGEEGGFIARRRHLDALARASSHLEQASAVLAASRAGELVAEELRLAQDLLGEITGKVSSDALLGRIFSSFCIGK
jgi:tRNA modification GTPase